MDGLQPVGSDTPELLEQLDHGIGSGPAGVAWGSLMASAAIAGFAGLIYSWKFATFSNSVGPPLLFTAVGAAFFGASQLKGRPNVWGTIIAVYTLAFGIKGIGLRYPREIDWMQPLFEGLTLIIAVALASRQGVVKVARRRSDPRDAPRAAAPPSIDAGRTVDATTRREGD